MNVEKNIEMLILKGLFENSEYFRTVLVNMNPKYFKEDVAPIVSFIKDHFSLYNKIPEYSTVVNSICNNSEYDEELKNSVEQNVQSIKNLHFNSIAEQEWLIVQTKSHINKRAMFSAVRECVEEMKSPQLDSGKIEMTLQTALSLNWNEDLGIEYFNEDEMDATYDYLCDSTKRIPLGIDMIDSAINGGIPSYTKFLGVFVGQAGIGKTAILSNIAVNAIKAGKNVLYITLEIDKKELRKRFDSTYTGYSLRNILSLRKNVKEKLANSRNHEKAGRCIIHEFPPSSVSAFDIKNYIKQILVWGPKAEYK